MYFWCCLNKCDLGRSSQSQCVLHQSNIDHKMSTQSKTVCEIKNFMEFLEQNLKQKVLSYTLKPLTAAGDNYGSIIQSLDVKVAKVNFLIENFEHLSNSMIYEC